MKDKYLKFSNSRIGSKVVELLGLPQPLKLQRYQPGQALIEGDVLLNSGDSELAKSMMKLLQAMQVPIHLFDGKPADLSFASWTGDQPVKAIIYDASTLCDSRETKRLYEFFHRVIRLLAPQGRIIVLGRPPEDCTDRRMAVVQRGLEGFTRSLAKEVRQASTVQLVYVENGTDDALESTLRFLLSPRSAYVTGQVLRTQTSHSTNLTVDWDRPFEGRRVLVTGASQGIGLAIAETFAREGAKVICLDIPSTKQKLRDLALRLNGTELSVDLRADNAADVITAAALQDEGWDVIVHNAGITQDKTIAKMSADQWSAVIDVNLSAQEKINDALLSAGAINRNGRIVAVSSISGIAGNRGQTNYGFSKAGVIGLVNAYAPHVVENEITINAVAPGFIETSMTAKMPFGVREAGRRLNSLSQGGLPVDVAEAILFFSHPGSSALNGNTLRVCGQNLLGA